MIAGACQNQKQKRGERRERAPAPSYVRPTTYAGSASFPIVRKRQSQGGNRPMFYAGFREFSYRTKHATKHAGKGEGKGAGSVLRPTPRSRVFYWYIHKDRVTGGNRPIFYAGFASFSIVQSTKTKKGGETAKTGRRPRPMYYPSFASFHIVRKGSRRG